MVWSARLIDPALLVVAVALAVVGVLSAGAVGVALVAGGAILAGVVLYRAHRLAVQAQSDLAELSAREREARVLAEAATALLASPTAAVKTLAPRMERLLAEAGARIELCHAPAPHPDEAALPLRMDGNTGWLYVSREGPLSRADAERLQHGLADLIRVAQERTRVAVAAVEAEASRRAEVTRTSLMHAISHDLRAPLVSMSDAANGLRQPELDRERRAELAAVVCAETARLDRIVDDLLDLSRIEAGAVNPQADWVDLNALVAQAIETVRAQRGEFPLRVDLPHDLPLVRADAAQLHRVFANLVDNAAKFSPPGEVVEVRGVCANGRVTIRVIDHGPGIPAAQQAQIFRPFVRGRDEEGSGLGLAICRGFVEANGGRIALQSRGRTGSAFAVSLPTSPQPSPVA